MYSNKSYTSSTIDILMHSKQQWRLKTQLSMNSSSHLFILDSPLTMHDAHR